MVVKAHRLTVTSLYRSILDMACRFPDDVASDYIIWRARTMFRRRATENSYRRVQAHLKEGLRYRRRIGRALEGDFSSFTYILELAYGGRGRVKHLLKVGHALLVTTRFGRFVACGRWAFGIEPVEFLATPG